MSVDTEHPGPEVPMLWILLGSSNKKLVHCSQLCPKKHSLCIGRCPAVARAQDGLSEVGAVRTAGIWCIFPGLWRPPLYSMRAAVRRLAPNSYVQGACGITSRYVICAGSEAGPRTLYDKIWADHLVHEARLAAGLGVRRAPLG